MCSGASVHVGAPAQEEDVRNAIFCSVAKECPIKVSFGLWCFWHAYLYSHAPPPQTTCSRVPKTPALPRGVALCPTLTTPGQLCAALGTPFPPPAVLDPLSNTRQAAARTINTVINREPLPSGTAVAAGSAAGVLECLPGSALPRPLQRGHGLVPLWL